MFSAYKLMIMSQSRLSTSLLSVLTLICLVCTVSASPSLHPDEVEALEDIASTLGIKHLNLSEDPCLTKTLVITQDVLKEGHNSTIRCDFHFNNNKTYHITHL
ncbi:Leucine-rich repeat transmembrane protein kinase [Raphanus sativus]|nr:Leucine-rich repeat transmembrane protein kinase [Raphanus sativus]